MVRMTGKKIAVGVAISLGLVMGVYFTYFHRPPTDDILAANKGSRSKKVSLVRKSVDSAGDDDYYYDDDYDESKSDDATALWDAWLEKNDYVSIGEIYDSCDESSRTLVGKVIMLKDTEKGGVKSRTYVNVTYNEEVTGGEMYIEVQYNTKDLYSNHWDLCTVEEGMEDQIIFCPIKPGKKRFIKDLKIPNYLPKGRYTTKAWLTNQDDKTIGCAFSDFTI